MLRFTTLVETHQLRQILDDPDVAIIDCRFELKDTSWGELAYAESHIPGAVYADLDRDLCGPKTGTNGRHPLPAPAAAAHTFGRLGIDDRVQVIAYDQDTGMYASRLWWMLRWLGHDAVAVLDGGFKKWLDDRGPVSSAATPREPRLFAARIQPEMLAAVDEVAAHAPMPDWRLIDARAPERYRGDIEPIDRVPGHIPGAANRPYLENLDDHGTFRPAGELAQRFREVLGDVPPDRSIAYCGSGVTACHNLLAMERAGLRGGKLYAGSWSEWSADPKRPIGVIKS